METAGEDVVLLAIRDQTRALIDYKLAECGGAAPKVVARLKERLDEARGIAADAKAALAHYKATHQEATR